jgi:hypothetical protein
MVVVILAMFQTTASANAGMPMIILIEPVLVLALIPVIIVESVIMAKIIGSVKFPRILSAAAISNLCSTLIGVPITWLLLLGLEIAVPGGGSAFPNLPEAVRVVLYVTLEAPWMLPFEEEFKFLYPIAWLVLLVPFFLVSYWMEYAIIRTLAKHFRVKENRGTIKSAVFRANAVSYALLALVPIAYLIVALLALRATAPAG